MEWEAQMSEHEKANIYKAMFEVQKELGVVKKGSDNPFYKSKYANLVQVMEVVNPLLIKNNLLVVHSPENVFESAVLRLRTEIIHVPTGEKIDCVLPIPLGKATAQEVGGACSYGRRYNTCCLLNVLVEDDDDDGNAISGVGKKQPQPTRSKPAPNPKKNNDGKSLSAAETLAPFVQNIETEERLRAYYRNAVGRNETLTTKDREELDALFTARAQEIRGEGDEDGGN
jgi:hypothetical protein